MNIADNPTNVQLPGVYKTVGGRPSTLVLHTGPARLPAASKSER